MGADNWAICPQCKVNAEAEQKKKMLEAGKVYGTVPSEEFLRLAHEAAQPLKLEETLREDCEIKMGRNGLFFVDYVADCTECGFMFRYKHEQGALKK